MLTPHPQAAAQSPLLARWDVQVKTERIAILDSDGAHPYSRIDTRARQIAAALLEDGTSPEKARRTSLDGERVGLLVTPGATFVEAFFGVLRAGGCVVVLSPLHPAPETSYFCEHAEVRAILATRELAHECRAGLGTRRVLDVVELGSRAAVDVTLPAPAAEDAALQLYTSGTTGKPKGAIITHANLAIQQELLGGAWGWTPDDVLLHALPLHHLHGLGIALLTALGAGARTRILPGFDAMTVWNAMASCSVFMAVPTMYAKLLASFDAADDQKRARWTANAKGLRLATSGSAALPVTLAERWRAITGQIPLERFGMTEVGVGMTNPYEGERRPGYVGMPLPTVEARVVGEDGKDVDLPPGGELWLRGPSIFRGYWRNDEATTQAFADDGWFRTGDTVTRDATGYFKILGRTSVDILKSGGYKLSALEIEEVLRENDAVAEVAVVGIPDETWGERVVA